MKTDDVFSGDADIEQAELYAAGRAASRGTRKMLQHRAAGRRYDAAAACPHGSGYQTNSPAAKTAKDPRAGQPGMRCMECGSWWPHAASLFDLRNARADAPCELTPR